MHAFILYYSLPHLNPTNFLIISDANLLNKWSSNPYAKTQIPEKPSKSGLIGVWHKDNLYLGTNTIGNENPRPKNIDLGTRSIRMTPQSQLLFDKSFFSFLENQRKEIIPPTHNKCGKRSLLLWKLRNIYISGYAFIYTDSSLKQTLRNPICGLIWGPLTIKPK
jgi:hypothetical protein